MHYTGPQISAAIALSGLTQEQIAAEASIGRNTLNKIINGRATYRQETIGKLRTVLEGHGIEFTPAEGVRRKDRTVTIHEHPDAYRTVLDDVYATLKVTGGEVLIAFVDEAKGLEVGSEQFLHKHLERLRKANITERLIVRACDTALIAPLSSYHRLPDHFFSPHQLYIYGTRIAHLARLNTHKAIIINDERFADSMRQLFEFVWACTTPALRNRLP